MGSDKPANGRHTTPGGSPGTTWCGVLNDTPRPAATMLIVVAILGDQRCGPGIIPPSSNRLSTRSRTSGSPSRWSQIRAWPVRARGLIAGNCARGLPEGRATPIGSVSRVRTPRCSSGGGRAWMKTASNSPSKSFCTPSLAAAGLMSTSGAACPVTRPVSSSASSGYATPTATPRLSVPLGGLRNSSMATAAASWAWMMCTASSRSRRPASVSAT